MLTALNDVLHRTISALPPYDPHELQLSAIKHILRYFQGTPSHGLLLQPTTLSTLVVYSDADWAGCSDTPSLPLVLLCFLETILFLGPPNGRIVSPAPVLQRYCRSLLVAPTSA